METAERDEILSMVRQKFITNKLFPISLLTWLRFHYMEYFNYRIFLLVIRLLHFRTRNLTDLSL